VSRGAPLLSRVAGRWLPTERSERAFSGVPAQNGLDRLADVSERNPLDNEDFLRIAALLGDVLCTKAMRSEAFACEPGTS